MEHSRRETFGLAAAIGLASALSPLAARPARRSTASSVYRAEPPAPTLREGLTRSGSAQLWWWDTGGTGPAVVLLHPATGNGLIWQYQQQAFVNAGFRVLGYSRRGAAGTVVSDPKEPISDVDDLKAILANRAIDRFHLVGSAGGSFVATQFAHTAHNRLESLVLANSLLGVTGDEIDPMLKNLQLGALSKLPVEMRELGPAYRVAYPQGVARWLELSNSNPPRQSLGGALPAASASGVIVPPKFGISLDNLRSINVPTLLIAGDADLLAPPPLMEVFARYFPDASTLQLPACGHSAYWENPDQFNEAVIGFVKSAERKSRKK